MATPLPLPTTAVVTGAGNGIGRALATRLAHEGLGVVVADLDADAVSDLAARIGATAWIGDCASQDCMDSLVLAAEEVLGRVDLFVANAGIAAGAGLDTSDDVWSRSLEVNTMAHVRAARAMVPRWLADGRGGRFLVTASAAGLLTMVGNAPYSVSKHAAVAFAEWLSVTYRDVGIVVQALCPQGVRTSMIDDVGAVAAILHPGALEPEEVADAVWQALATDTFYVLPHPEVAERYASRAAEPDEWMASMNRLQSRIGLPRPWVAS